MELKYTRHQVARGSRADAEVDGALYLLKRVKVLHATYQVRLLTYRAQKEGLVLVIRVPSGFRPGRSLEKLRNSFPGVIRIERSDS